MNAASVVTVLEIMMTLTHSEIVYAPELAQEGDGKQKSNAIKYCRRWDFPTFLRYN